MKIFAMIPARSGSKGLADKNILPAGGVPLIGQAVNFAKKLDIDRIIVSTDSKKYFDIAAEYEPMIWWHNRGEFASSDTAREEHIIHDYVEIGGETPDIWVWLKPTSPFRHVQMTEDAINILVSSPHVDSVRVVSVADARLQCLNEEDWLESFVSSFWPAGKSKIPRHEAPKVYKPYNLEVFRHSNWKGLHARFMGHRIRAICSHKITGLDIDDQADLDLADGIIRIDPRPEWLKPYVHI